MLSDKLVDTAPLNDVVPVSDDIALIDACLPWYFAVRFAYLKGCSIGDLTENDGVPENRRTPDLVVLHFVCIPIADDIDYPPGVFKKVCKQHWNTSTTHAA